MNRHQPNGLAYYTFPSLDGFPELIHGVTTRHGGVSTGQYASLNLTKGTGRRSRRPWKRICAGRARRWACAGTIWSAPTSATRPTCAASAQADRGQIFAGYDMLITDEPGVPLLLRYADCTPVLIYDPAHRALAVVHSGWRGTVQARGRAAVEALAAEFGSRPADMVAAIGPSIGPCCYEVGDEVVDAVRAAFARPDGAAARPGRRPAPLRPVGGQPALAGRGRRAARSRSPGSAPPAAPTSFTPPGREGARRGISAR